MARITKEIGRMKSVILLYLIAAGCSGASWWAYVVGQTVPKTASLGITELIQLGGTGGLIVSLLWAVITLWKERSDLRKDWSKEKEHLVSHINNMRTDHHAYIDKLQTRHQEELHELTEKYTQELKTQIATLRQETETKLHSERAVSDDKYRKS